MKNKNPQFILLIILLAFSIVFNAILIYKSVEDSLTIYSLEFFLSKEKSQTKTENEVKYDRYDAIQVLRSQSCFQYEDYIYEVSQSEEEKDLWDVKVFGKIDNPETGNINDYISTLGIYTVNKKNAVLKDRYSNANDICIKQNYNVESARDKLMSYKCLKDYINESQRRYIEVSTDTDNSNLWVFRLYEDIGGHNATKGWYSVDKESGKVKDILVPGKEICES